MKDECRHTAILRNEIETPHVPSGLEIGGMTYWGQSRLLVELQCVWLSISMTCNVKKTGYGRTVLDWF